MRWTAIMYLSYIAQAEFVLCLYLCPRVISALPLLLLKVVLSFLKRSSSLVYSAYSHYTPFSVHQEMKLEETRQLQPVGLCSALHNSAVTCHPECIHVNVSIGLRTKEARKENVKCVRTIEEISNDTKLWKTAHSKIMKKCTLHSIKGKMASKCLRQTAKKRLWLLFLWMHILIFSAECMRPATSDKTLSIKGPEHPFCSSKRIVNDVLNLNKLDGCEIIEGDLEIVLIEGGEWQNYSFPKLVQITGFLLIYRVNGLISLGQLFPNLSVIRGITLHQRYALVIYEAMHLETIDLYSLTSILRGSVRIQNNRNLCYIDTIDWSAITKKEIAGTENVFKNNNEYMCRPCSSSSGCQRDRCWSSSKCQKLCKSDCIGGCTADGECCHVSCIGGCSTPNNASTCFACQNVSHHGMCFRTCPISFYKYLDYRCVSEKECNDTRDHLLYVPLHGEQRCLRECPRDYQKGIEDGLAGSKIKKCIKCDGSCNKECPSQFVNSIEKARNFAGCTLIDGPLIISITGGKNIVKELSQSLDSIREVKDYVRVFSTSALRSLEFLRSLKTIRGENLYNHKYALYVHGNDNLETIWDWDKHVGLSITKENATVLFHSNPQLCYERIEELLEKTGHKNNTSNLNMKISNGNKVACKILEQSLILRPLRRRGVIELEWLVVPSQDDRMLNGYYVYYKPAEEYITYLAGRDACDDDWERKYVEIKKTDIWIKRNLTGLMPATRYALYVETDTVVEADSGARSAISYATTLPYNPDNPENVKVLKKEDSITLSWSPPLHSNGIIDHYAVTISPYPDTVEVACPTNPGLNPVFERVHPEEDLVSSTTPASVDFENITAPPGNPLGECCTCSIETRWQQRQDDIVFENELFSWVFTSRKKRDVVEELWIHGEKMVNSESLLSRTKRNTAETESMLYRPYEVSSDLDDNDITSEEHVPIASPYIEHGNCSTVEAGDVSGPRTCVKSTRDTNITLSNLSHFTRYLIRVVACHAPFPKSSSKPSGKEHAREVLCSLNPLPIVETTLRKVGANQIKNLKVIHDDADDDIKFVSWDPPLQPNGKLVGFIIIMHPRTSHLHWSSTGVPQQFCISAKKFESMNNTYELNERDFAPGLYDLSIKAYTYPSSSSNESYENVLVEIESKGVKVASLDISIWIITAVLFVLLLVVVIVVIHRANTKKMDGFVTVNPRYDTVPPTWSQKILSAFSREHIIDMQDLKLNEGYALGKGNFGLVLKGTLCLNSVDIPIAAKVATENHEKDDIIEEAKLMLKLDCYHLVKAYGIAACSTQVYLVMDFMARGSLLEYLRKLYLMDNDIFSALTLDTICAMGVQIADGMAYLASNRIVHRDLAARNCLIDDQNNIKISDFGMSRLTGNDYYQICTTNFFPVRWLPPEYLISHRFTCHSDIWSYGIVLWEILTAGAKPYKNFSDNTVIEEVKNGYTLASELPEGTPSFLAKVISDCWRFNEYMRPYFPQIIAALLPNTSPWFAEHYRMVSFYHTKKGEEYRKHLETLQDVEDETRFTNYMTTSSPSGIFDRDGQPPSLPARPFMGLKWTTSLSFPSLTTSRSIRSSVETSVRRSVQDSTFSHQAGLENGTDDDTSFTLPVEIEEYCSSETSVSVTKKPELAATSTSGLTDTEVSSDFKEIIIPTDFKLDFHSSSSANTPKEVRDVDIKSESSICNVVSCINNKGKPFSLLASSRTKTGSSLSKLPKALTSFRSVSSPNIKPAAC